MPRLFAVTALLLAAAVACRAEDRNTITVKGKGTVSVRPDRLVLVFGAKGDAEKAADAVEKLRKKSKDIREAIDAVLKNTSLNATVGDSGVTISPPASQNPMIMMGGNKDEAAGNIVAQTEIEIRVPGVDAMKPGELEEVITTLLDKAVEAGADIASAGAGFNVFMQAAGGATGVFYEFSNFEASVDKAWDEAVRKARERAESISRRLGLTVGDAVRVRDTSAGETQVSESAGKNPMAAIYGMMGSDSPRLKSSGAKELTVEIEVEFELKKK